MKEKIELGDKVKCIYSGFTGTAVSRTQYINGCVQYSVVPKISKDMKIPEEFQFDEQSLEVISKNKNVIETEETGGPMRKSIKQKGF